MDRISVFIASPGDLNDERERFHASILEINRLKAEHLGLKLEPLGWGDTVPGRGRPQELINREIESCDLFVLLLWKRWGTPTGKYSSGTEEEFELARRLSETPSGRPAIWLYFKKVPDEMMADPGPQLQQVLAFRTRIEEERSFLYRAFDAADDWAKMFKEHLAKWLDKRQPFESPPKQIVLLSQQTERVELLATAQSDGGTAQEKLSNAAKILRLRALEAARAGRFTDAEVLFASSMATCEDLETLNSYGLFLDSLGELSRAQQLFDRLVVTARAAGERSLLATAYANLGHICAKRSDMKTAANFWALASEAAGVKLVGEPENHIEFYSCFISYATNDQAFAERLYADLQANGVRCWFAPHDIRGGKKLHEQIDTAIRIHERLLLILSAASIHSPWVKSEIAKARKREITEEKRVLFPIRLQISFGELQKWELFDADTGKDSAREIREYFIPDFTNWKDHDSYTNAFKQLLDGLKGTKSRDADSAETKSLISGPCLAIHNFSGHPGPLLFSGVEHSAHGPQMVLSCRVTLVNNTQRPMKITPRRLLVAGADAPVLRFFFQPLSSSPPPKLDLITLLGNHKEDYKLNLMFPDDIYPKTCSGDLLIQIDDNVEQLLVNVVFP